MLVNIGITHVVNIYLSIDQNKLNYVVYGFLLKRNEANKQKKSLREDGCLNVVRVKEECWKGVGVL